MNMILNPLEMTQKDQVAQDLFAEYLVQMTFQNVDEAEARKLLEYFRYYAAKGEIQDDEKPKKPRKAKKASASSAPRPNSN
jgi:hypothetical protein